MNRELLNIQEKFKACHVHFDASYSACPSNFNRSNNTFAKERYRTQICICHCLLLSRLIFTTLFRSHKRSVVLSPRVARHPNQPFPYSDDTKYSLRILCMLHQNYDLVRRTLSTQPLCLRSNLRSGCEAFSRGSRGKGCFRT